MSPSRRELRSGLIAALALTPVVATAQIARDPTFKTFTSPTPTSIKLRWVCPAGATGFDVFATPAGGAPVKLTSAYLVFRQSPGQQAFQQITPAPLATAAFQETVPARTHQYYVQAVSGNPSAPVSVLVGRPQVGSVVVSPEYSGTIDFSWSGTADATGIALVKATSPGGPFAATNAVFARTNGAARARHQWERSSTTRSRRATMDK